MHLQPVLHVRSILFRPFGETPYWPNSCLPSASRSTKWLEPYSRTLTVFALRRRSNDALDTRSSLRGLLQSEQQASITTANGPLSLVRSSGCTRGNRESDQSDGDDVPRSGHVSGPRVHTRCTGDVTLCQGHVIISVSHCACLDWVGAVHDNPLFAFSVVHSTSFSREMG